MVIVALAGKRAGDRVALLDDVDVDLTELRWHLHDARRSRIPYAIRHHRGTTAYLHRIVMARVLGRDLAKGELVDHANRDSLDNTRSNLRVATRHQNAMNSDSSPRSGHRGVLWCPRKELWRAEVWCHERRLFSRYCKTLPEAIEARRLAALGLFGEFAPTTGGGAA